jgi:hypothetical protein
MSLIGFLVICHDGLFSPMSPIIIGFSVIHHRHRSICIDMSPVGFSVICQGSLFSDMSGNIFSDMVGNFFSDMSG